MISGIYYEFISFPCGKRRYSMPLGIIWAPQPAFYIYKTAGLSRLIDSSGTLFLLSPSDPLLFLESINHTLELKVAFDDNGCPRPSELGSWYRCDYVINYNDNEKVGGVCRSFIPVRLASVPYTRLYGCLVELLVILTKARAGVIKDWYLEYARGLRDCIERSSRGAPRYVAAADSALQELEGIIRQGQGKP